MTSILSREDTRQTGVYVIRNTVTGKRYVGSASKSFKQRWSNHYRTLNRGKHHSNHLQRSWNTYGPLYFVFEIVERTATEHAVAQEQVFIDWWHSADPKHGYNKNPMAESCRGVKRSAESKANLSAQRKGKKMSDAARQAMSESQLASMTPERRAKMAAAQKGRKHSDETKRKIGEGNSNPSPEKSAKLSAKNLGRKLSDDAKARIGNANRGRKHTPESLKKMSDAHKNISDETREKIAAVWRGRKHTPETREKMSKAQTGRIISPETIAKTVYTKLVKRAACWNSLSQQQQQSFLYSHNGMTPQQFIDSINQRGNK